MKTIKIGVIGAGGISHAHAGGYRQQEGVELHAVADIVPGRAPAWAERYGVPYHFTDYRKLLELDEIDAVSVCTYNRAHKGPTVEALQAGKHVLCEKPVAHNLADAAAMLRAAAETGKMLMIGVHSRFSPAQQLAAQVVREGGLGDVYYAETVGTRRRGIPGGTFIQKSQGGGGAIIDIGVYSLDTALHIMGHPKPVRVSALTQDYLGTHTGPPEFSDAWWWDPAKMEVDEFGAAWIRFDNGAVLVFKISWAVHAESLGQTYFLGTKGGLQLSPLTIYRDEFGSMVNVTPVHLRSEPDRFKEETGAFVNAVRSGGPNPIPIEEVI
jgi:predicted dehydrogenase